MKRVNLQNEISDFYKNEILSTRIFIDKLKKSSSNRVSYQILHQRKKFRLSSVKTNKTPNTKLTKREVVLFGEKVSD